MAPNTKVCNESIQYTKAEVSFTVGGRDYLGDSSGFFGRENETCDRLSFLLVFLAAAWLSKLSTLSTPTRFDDGGQRRQQRQRQHEEAVVVETSIQEGCSRSSIRSLKNEIMGSLNGIGMDHFTSRQQVEILWGLPEYGE